MLKQPLLIQCLPVSFVNRCVCVLSCLLKLFACDLIESKHSRWVCVIIIVMALWWSSATTGNRPNVMRVSVRRTTRTFIPTQGDWCADACASATWEVFALLSMIPFCFSFKVEIGFPFTAEQQLNLCCLIWSNLPHHQTGRQTKSQKSL